MCSRVVNVLQKSVGSVGLREALLDVGLAQARTIGHSPRRVNGGLANGVVRRRGLAKANATGAKGRKRTGRGGKVAGSLQRRGRAIEPMRVPIEGISGRRQSPLSRGAGRSDLGPAERSSKARNRAVMSIGRVTEMPEARHPRSSREENALEQTEQGCPPKRLERRETLYSRAVQVDSISRRRKLPKRAVIARWSRAKCTGEAQASTRNRNQRGAGARS